jgi:hypothetical protein
MGGHSLIEKDKSKKDAYLSHFECHCKEIQYFQMYVFKQSLNSILWI